MNKNKISHKNLQDNLELLYKIKHENTVPNRLWHCGYYDGAQSGICEYNGKRHWFESLNDFDHKLDSGEWFRTRIFAIIELTPEQLKYEEKKQKLWTKYNGHTNVYINGKRKRSSTISAFVSHLLEATGLTGWAAYKLKEKEIPEPESTRYFEDNNVVAWCGYYQDSDKEKQKFFETINAKIKRQKIRNLKNKIKELANEGTNIRKEIQTLSGIERYEAWERKRNVGKDARHHLITYGLLRAKDYHTQIEPNKREYVDWDYAFTSRIHEVHKILQEYCTEIEREKWSKTYVKEILSCNSSRRSKRSAGNHG